VVAEQPDTPFSLRGEAGRFVSALGWLASRAAIHPADFPAHIGHHFDFRLWFAAGWPALGDQQLLSQSHLLFLLVGLQGEIRSWSRLLRYPPSTEKSAWRSDS